MHSSKDGSSIIRIPFSDKTLSISVLLSLFVQILICNHLVDHDLIAEIRKSGDETCHRIKNNSELLNNKSCLIKVMYVFAFFCPLQADWFLCTRKFYIMCWDEKVFRPLVGSVKAYMPEILHALRYIQNQNFDKVWGPGAFK